MTRMLNLCWVNHVKFTVGEKIYWSPFKIEIETNLIKMKTENEHSCVWECNATLAFNHCACLFNLNIAGEYIDWKKCPVK